MQQLHYDVAIIGGGILGCSIAYFLASFSNASAVVIEQENNFGMHGSRRNTGKVHAPFIYDPAKRSLTAKAALKGFDMLRKYCKVNSLPFKEDGVMEVATSEGQIDTLHRYLEWGYKNGLTEDQLKFLAKEEVAKVEPNVSCHSAIVCFRDASTDYELITKQLICDAQKFGCRVMPNSRFRNFAHNNHLIIRTEGTEKEIIANYVINAGGGYSLNIAHGIGLATEYRDLYFRGEYWQAPHEYSDLTHMSIYSVPKYSEFPFLNPHWIIRADGRREVGPNAVPVFSPYSYEWTDNLKNSMVKIFQSSTNIGIMRLMMNSQFIRLASKEFWSSISKRAMVNRVRQFLPSLKPSAFTTRGVAGIRSSLTDKEGNFVPEMLILENDYSLHILNYNSPGATGALPVGAKIVSRLLEKGYLHKSAEKGESLWDISEILE